jgi:hypothetical protein
MLNFINKQATQDAAMAALLLSLLYLLQLVVFFGIGGRDDSYITYWPAYTLSHFGEIVNYNGDRIEQSSSLLQVLLLATLHKITNLPIPALGTPFSIGCGIITALLTGRLAYHIGVSFYKWVPFVVIFVPYFSYWSSSGMETSLAALCVILLLITIRIFLSRPYSKINFLYVTASILLFILVRPESAIVLLVFFIAMLALQIFTPAHPDKKTGISRIVFLIMVTLVFFAGLVAWRYVYFGQFFPQPVYAKTDISHTQDKLDLGLRYLEYSLNFSTTLLVALAMIGMAIFFLHNKKTINSPAVHSLLFVLVYLAFIVCTGGDWMEGRRLLVPILPPLCVLALTGIDNKNSARILLFLFFSLALIDSWRFAKEESIGLPPVQATRFSYLAGQLKPDDTKILAYNFNALDVFNYSHMRDMLTIPVLDELVTRLSKEKAEPVYIASRQMGMIPYYIASQHYKKVRFIDLRGLVTKDISDCHFISDSKPKGSSGILITSRFYLENQAQIAAECLLPTVDILYDTGLINNSAVETANMLSSNQYHLYYTQGNKTDNLFAQYIGINNKYNNLTP